jgi:hypothetical protein
VISLETAEYHPMLLGGKDLADLIEKVAWEVYGCDGGIGYVEKVEVLQVPVYVLLK